MGPSPMINTDVANLEVGLPYAVQAAAHDLGQR